MTNNYPTNAVAAFVYQVATRGHRAKLAMCIAGVCFYYGTVGLALGLCTLADNWLGLHLTIPAALRLPLGIIILAFGVPMVAWTIARFLKARGTPIPFSPPPTFVVDGLYRIVRNPMHLGWALVVIGTGVLRQSFTLLAMFTPVFIVAHVLYLKLVEEKELEQKFGQAYIEYRKRVGMWLPRLGKSTKPQTLNLKQMPMTPTSKPRLPSPSRGED